MFPIRDDNPHFLRPLTTWGLIAANVFVWVSVQGLGADAPMLSSLCNLGLIPADLLGRIEPGTQVALGEAARCTLGAGPSWYTPLTSMFMHGGWMHLLGNMWFLFIFGNNVEDSMGHVRFLAFYLLTGLAAAALQVLSAPGSTVPMVGASGAIGGVMGAYVVLYPRVRVQMAVFLGFFFTTLAVPAVFVLGYWFLLQLLGGFANQGAGGGGVAFWAHVGGFAAGALLVFPFRNPALVARHPYRGRRASRARGRGWRIQ